MCVGMLLLEQKLQYCDSEQSRFLIKMYATLPLYKIFFSKKNLTLNSFSIIYQKGLRGLDWSWLFLNYFNLFKKSSV